MSGDSSGGHVDLAATAAPREGRLLNDGAEKGRHFGKAPASSNRQYLV